ncbi:MAG: hypothetical protein ACJA01_002834 [Saprospiraceae bacterium]|jgi:hypothetical protein
MRKALIILIGILASSVAFGQIAFRGGINYSNVNIDGVSTIETDSKIGFHAGLQGNIAIGNVLAVRPALLYNIKGAKVTTNGADQSSALHYVEVPLNLGFRLGAGPIALILEGGPYYGYLVNTSDGLFNDIGKSDWGANFGAIIELDDIGIGVNYSNGLNDIEKEDQIGQAFKLQNGNLAVFAYFKF